MEANKTQLEIWEEAPVDKTLPVWVVCTTQDALTDIQHVAFTYKDYADKFATFIVSHKGFISVLELPYDSTSVKVNEYAAHMSAGLYPFYILMMDGGLIECSGHRCEDNKIDRIGKITYSSKDNAEYMSGTFWGIDSNTAVNKACKHWSELVEQGKLTKPIDADWLEELES